VFFGTTNAKEFLSDPSGNRRFIPIDINKDLATKDIFSLADSEVDQIWAEAVELFHAGETLFMSKEAEKLARAEQRDHSENDERRGLVEAYLETLLPRDWEAQDTFARRLYMSEGGKTGGAVERDAVCIAEIWCECLGKEKENMDRYKTREINDILRTLDGWEQSKSTKDFVHYGRQRYYRRKLC
jgi:predicted P-loop ATPase